MSTEIALWQPNKALALPKDAPPKQIIEFAVQLSTKDKRQIASAFEGQHYEMATSFIWQRAVASLKNELTILGMEFIGEMLGRPDIGDHSSIHTDVTDYEAITLAADLGMVNSTNAMRLKQSREMISHFAELSSDDSSENEMSLAEAVRCLETVVQSVLGKAKVEVPLEFAQFRKSLEQKTFQPSDFEIQSLKQSPYLFVRTTLNVLLSQVKGSDGAALGHGIGNLNAIIPFIWADLKKTEKWSIGQAYAEMMAAGKKTAATGIRKVLVAVRGFDFVPENLRSSSFSSAAQSLLSAHLGFNNFYNEPAPAETLEKLGTIIPMPAFAHCMTALMAVYLGNAYGISRAAQPPTKKLLDRLSSNQWDYYLNECFPQDRLILEKLSWHDLPRKRWGELVDQYRLADRNAKDPNVVRALEGGAKKQATKIEDGVNRLLKRSTYLEG